MRQPAQGIALEAQQGLHGLQGLAEEVMRPLRGAVQVGQAGEGRALDTREEEGGPTRTVDAALDLGHLEMGIHLLGDPEEQLAGFEVEDGVGKRGV